MTAAASITTGTNIDVNTLVSQLMSVEEQPLQVMQQQQQSYQSTISAYGQLSSVLSSLNGATTALQSASTFNQNSTTISDSTVLSATASTSAAAGTHSVVVSQLAQTQQLASGNFTSTSDAVGTGTLTFSFGTTGASGFTANPSATSFSVTIDSSNNTLSGVAAAINQANGGVQATVVYDGTGYRLALAPSNGGSANTLKIDASDSDGNNTDASGLSQLAYDPAATSGAGKNLSQTTSAQDAKLTIDGISITSGSNAITAIPGLTLNLSKTNVGAPVTVGVAKNTSAITSAINSFITAYNNFNSTTHTMTAYNATTKTAGSLQGDPTTASIIRQVKNALTSPVNGLAGGLSTLSQVGISLQADGSLSLDSTKLTAALSNPALNVASLFTTSGASSDTRVAYQSSLTSTPAGNYAIAITQPATHASLTGDSAAPLTITAGVNDTLSLNVDGATATVTLAPGTYADSTALATQIQSAINQSATIRSAGAGITVSQSGGVLSINSNSFGVNSSISALGGSAAALFGTSPTSAAGQNVAGTINGVAATGTGQTLVDSTTGLRVRVTATSAGSYGSINLTTGYGASLGSLLTSITDPTTGAIAARNQGLNDSINRLTQEESDFNDRMTTVEANYRSQFSALDAMLSTMKSTSDFLTQQLASISSSS
ncbi:MAG TPA: flagellar filament capping protein FliD [Burkholderiales bacterium]